MEIAPGTAVDQRLCGYPRRRCGAAAPTVLPDYGILSMSKIHSLFFLALLAGRRVTGPGTVSFWWKVSGETNRDTLRFYVSDSEQARISGEVDWQPQTFAVPAGSHELKWKFRNEGTNGQDGAWVDQVRFDPLPPT